jgi:hypothetical protein
MANLPKSLRPAKARTVGMNLVVSDSDDRTDMPHAWCKSNVMAWSNEKDGYRLWSDAQSCGEITFK